MNYLYLILSTLLLTSCAIKEENISKQVDIISSSKTVQTITELNSIPQNVKYYSKNIKESLFSQEEFEKKYFRVWNIERSALSLSEAMWAHRVYKVGDTYGENLQLLKQAFFDKILENANYSKYLTLNKKALTLKHLNIRAMPTNQPILRDPTQAGEGFPFDYLQNSSISANKPLLISHYSKDKKWAFIESSFAYGWVRSDSVVEIDEKYTQLWQQAEQIFITKEGTPIYSEDGDFLFKSRIGMMLALIGEDEESYSVLTVSKYKNKKPLYIKSIVDKDIAHKELLIFNTKNINMILNQISKTNYGWGGIYGQRDCSSTLRDFYAPFGLWLPRNSSQQAKMGEVISLNDLSSREKIRTIKEKAEPFRTLIYKKGHIGLYVGTYEDKVIMYQNVWGVKTMKDGVQGRFIIGKPIFSTLEVGSNLNEYDADSSMLKKLKSISTL